MPTSSPATPVIGTPEQWLAARRELLRQEKEFTGLGDALAARRRKLPWVKVGKNYRFDSEEGCKSCSFMMDHIAPAVVHLAARDVAFAAVSHAPLAEILPFKRRMDWNVNWVSSDQTDFNEDFNVSFTPEDVATGRVYYNYGPRPFPHEEAPGISVFARGDDGTVYHTYSTYGRGVEAVMGTYHLLDLVPKGRDEAALDHGMEWVRHHDHYSHAAAR